MEAICLEQLISEFHAEGARPSDAQDALTVVLAEYIIVTSNGTNGRQHLLHQYDVAIITAINLSAKIDKNKARAS